MSAIELELYELLKQRIGEKETRAIFTLVENKVHEKAEDKKDTIIAEIDAKLAQQETRLTRSIYIVGLLQYLAILASLIAIIKYLM